MSMHNEMGFLSGSLSAAGSGPSAYNAYVAFQNACDDGSPGPPGFASPSDSMPDYPRTTYGCLMRYGNSDSVPERQVAVRHLAKALRSVDPYENVEEVGEIFLIIEKHFANDPDPLIRSELVEQIPMLVMGCQQVPVLVSRADDVLIPTIAMLINDPNNQVRKTCQAAIVIMLDQDLLSQDALKKQLCPALLAQTSNDSSHTGDLQGDTANEQRVEAVTLLCKIVTTPVVPIDWIFADFLGPYTHFMQDPVFHIRKVCAGALGELSRLFGEWLTEKLFVPHLLVLSQDSVWGVRKSCCETFAEIAVQCSPRFRRVYLAPRFIQLLQDSSRWVSYIAFQKLGQFIATFANANRTGLAVRDGRLVHETPSSSASPSPSASENTSPRMPTTIGDSSPGSMTSSDRRFHTLPAGVVVPSLPDHEMMRGASMTSPRRYTATVANTGEMMANGGANASVVTRPMRPADDVLHELADLFEGYTAIKRGDDDDDDADFGAMSAAAVASSVSDLSRLLMTDDVHASSLDDDAIGDWDDWENPTDAFDDRGLHARSETAKRKEESGAGNEELAFSSMVFWSQAVVPCETRALSYATDADRDRDETAISRAAFIARRSDILYSSPPTTHVESTMAINERGKVETAKDEQSAHAEGQQANVQGRINKGFTSMNVLRRIRIIVCFVFDADNSAKQNVSSTYLDDSTFSDEIEETTDDSQDVIPQGLLDNFIMMVEPGRSQSAPGENEMTRFCAHSFPAVALTLGREFWPQLKQTYTILANDIQWRVRQTLAFSIHEMAVIVGEEYTEKDLVPVFQGLLKDLDEVRIGVLKNLYSFYRVLRPATRKTLLIGLADFLHADNVKNWRFRHEFTKQCILLCELLDINDLNEYMAAIALTLATDRIAEIRREAAHLLGAVLARFVDAEWGTQSTAITVRFVDDILKAFPQSARWIRRHTYTIFCEKALELTFLTEEQFDGLRLLDSLLVLAADAIPNTRIAFARALTLAVATGYFTGDRLARLEAVLKRQMLQDVDDECRRAARRALGVDDPNEPAPTEEANTRRGATPMESGENPGNGDSEC